MVGKWPCNNTRSLMYILSARGEEWEKNIWKKNQLRWVWFILYINLSEPHVPRFNLVSGCFWMKLAFGTVVLVDCPPQCGWEPSNPLRAGIEWNVEEGVICSFPCLMDWARTSHLISLARGLGFTSLTPLVLRPSDSDWSIPPDFQFPEGWS